MPSSRKTTKAALAAAAAMPSIPKELIDQFVTGPMSAEAVNAASMAFKKALIERALGAELTHHLGYAVGTLTATEQDRYRIDAAGTLTPVSADVQYSYTSTTHLVLTY